MPFGDGAHDEPGVLGLQLLGDVAQPLAFALLEAAGDADAAPAGHVHQVAPGERDLGAQPRALVPHRVLGDLHQHLLAVLERVGDAPGALLAVRRRHLVHVQEPVLLEAEVDERRVDAVHDVLDLALVDVAQVGLAVRPLDVDLGQAPVFDERHTQLLAVVGDEDDLALRPLGDDGGPSLPDLDRRHGAEAAALVLTDDGPWAPAVARPALGLGLAERRLAGLGLGRGLAAGIRRLGLAGLKRRSGVLGSAFALAARAAPAPAPGPAPLGAVLAGFAFSGLAGRAALGRFLGLCGGLLRAAPGPPAASGASAWASPVAGSPAASSASRAASSCSMSELLRRRRPPRLPRRRRLAGVSSPSPSWPAPSAGGASAGADSAAASGAAGGVADSAAAGAAAASGAAARGFRRRGRCGSRRRSCRRRWALLLRAPRASPRRPAPSRSRRACGTSLRRQTAWRCEPAAPSRLPAHRRRAAPTIPPPQAPAAPWEARTSPPRTCTPPAAWRPAVGPPRSRLRGARLCRRVCLSLPRLGRRRRPLVPAAAAVAPAAARRGFAGRAGRIVHVWSAVLGARRGRRLFAGRALLRCAHVVNSFRCPAGGEGSPWSQTMLRRSSPRIAGSTSAHSAIRSISSCGRAAPSLR